ncbi:hypothetical protein [Allomuricauda sp. R78024]
MRAINRQCSKVTGLFCQSNLLQKTNNK